MLKKVYIFGQNPIAELLAYYLHIEGKTFDGFIVNEKYLGDGAIESSCQPLYSIESVIKENAPENVAVYLPIGYMKMNNIRKQVHLWLKEHNIEVLSYVHPSAVIAKNADLGEGNIILEKVSISPFSHIGSCNFIGAGTIINHHSAVGNYNWLASNVVLAGKAHISNQCFLGVGSIIKNDSIIGNEVLVGAGAYVYKNLTDKQVFVPQRGIILEKTSDEMRI